MAEKRWRTWETVGLLVVLAAGNLLHFIYDWTGQSPIAAPLAAVNESTWEHMKLFITPWVLWSLVERIALRETIDGYSEVHTKAENINIDIRKAHYALLPVWILTYRDKAGKDELYYFAMNGQTGKICGKLPVAKGKLVKLFLEIFVPVAAILMIGGWFL